MEALAARAGSACASSASPTKHALQSWFVAADRPLSRSARTAADRLGRDPRGRHSRPAPRVMSWRGIDGALAAARAGHDAVLSPWPDALLRQSAGRLAPTSRRAAGASIRSRTSIASIRCRRADRGARPRTSSGLQGNLWTEHMRTEARAGNG